MQKTLVLELQTVKKKTRMRAGDATNALISDVVFEFHEVLQDGLAMIGVFGQTFNIKHILVQFFFVAAHDIGTVDVTAGPSALVPFASFNLCDFGCDVSAGHADECRARERGRWQRGGGRLVA